MSEAPPLKKARISAETEDAQVLDAVTPIEGVDSSSAIVQDESDEEQYLQRVEEQMEERTVDVEAVLEERRKQRIKLQELYPNAAHDFQPEPDASSKTEALFVRTGGPSTASCSDSLVKKTRSEQICPDDDFDMFAEDQLIVLPVPLAKKKFPSLSAGPAKGDNEAHLTDNWNDELGYYVSRVGEIILDRYVVESLAGKGVFSSVVICRDRQLDESEKKAPTAKKVALKIVRQGLVTLNTAKKELAILRRLQERREDDDLSKEDTFIIKLENTFVHREHLVLVFEAMHMNLRIVISRFGSRRGLSLSAVAIFARQLMLALAHLRNCGIIHADIKPDNILINQAMNRVSLCDFGCAMQVDAVSLTPYLVSRFYRAPEIMLGLPLTPALDMWSIAVSLYEMYTGSIMFDGRDNNQMLEKIMEKKGPFPSKLLKKGRLTSLHFLEDGRFILREFEALTQQNIGRHVHIRPLTVPQPLFHAVRRYSTGENVTKFVDFLERATNLDSQKRVTPAEALEHPFLLKMW